MVLRFQAAAIGAAIALTASVGAASAASMVDVDNLLIGSPFQGAGGPAATSYVWPGVRREQSIYQTWTVGKTGRLDRIDLYGSVWSQRSLAAGAYYEDLNFTLTLGVYRGGGADAPGTFELAAISKIASEIGTAPSVTSFDFSSYDISAVEGEILTFKMFVETCPDMFECGNVWGNLNEINGVGTTNGYLGGNHFFDQGSQPYLAGDQDLNFRTWMSAVPEPSAWAMMIIGFGGVGSILRTSRRQLTA